MTVDPPMTLLCTTSLVTWRLTRPLLSVCCVVIIMPSVGEMHHYWRDVPSNSKCLVPYQLWHQSGKAVLKAWERLKEFRPMFDKPSSRPGGHFWPFSLHSMSNDWSHSWQGTNYWKLLKLDCFLRWIWWK